MRHGERQATTPAIILDETKASLWLDQISRHGNTVQPEGVKKSSKPHLQAKIAAYGTETAGCNVPAFFQGFISRRYIEGSSPCFMEN